MITIEDKAEFLNLASALSPENLHCDGEISRSAAMAKKRKLDAQWAALERKVGRKVTENETWGWHREVDEHHTRQREAFMATQPQHPLLKHKNPGVWSREGENGMSAYYIQNAAHREPFIINGIELPLGDDEFILYSEFNRYLSPPKPGGIGNEKLGTFDTLEAAVDAAEAFLATVTFEAFKATQPMYRDENIERELKRLPAKGA